jgi:predicted nucleic acid-binding protein
MEVCQGVGTIEEFKKLWNIFLGFEKLLINEETWELSSFNYFRCRKKGVTLGSMDSLIMSIALQNRISIWTKDKDYKSAEKVLGLDLWV